MSKARVGVVIIRKRNHRFFLAGGELFSRKSILFFPWALLACRPQIKPALPCHVIPYPADHKLKIAWISIKNELAESCRESLPGDVFILFFVQK